MIILGIDPGLRISGFSILKKDGRTLYVCDYGYLSMSSQKSIVERIGIFHEFYTHKIKQWHVTDIALETPFLGKNAQNFLKLGYLRGILYLLAHEHNLKVHEYAPREIKMAVTGYGAASKDQVARVIQQLFPRLEKPKKEDVTDALAITLCAIWQANTKVNQLTPYRR